MMDKWEELFKDYKHTNLEMIASYLEEHPEAKEPLTKLHEEGKQFLAIKKAFYKANFPQFLPKERKKGPTLNDVFGKKKK